MARTNKTKLTVLESFIEASGGNATRALKHVDRRVAEESYLDPRICETHHENELLFALT